MNIVSLFAGCGGMDLGFKSAGFETVWANEFDKFIAPTFQKNFSQVEFDGRSIVNIRNGEIPDAIGVIGGPPCQSWSEAGSRRGINDSRGQLFFEYIRVIENKKPLFFVAENVAGITYKNNSSDFTKILGRFEEIGYNVKSHLVNASDYGVPQDRKRVVIVGYKKSMKKEFCFPQPSNYKPTLRDAIGDLKGLKLGTQKIRNHDLFDSGYSPIFMSRNRVRNWDEQSFTILACDRHIPFHPQAPKMIKVGREKMAFASGMEHLYRRLSVRECARIQTFPDWFDFLYEHPRLGYKMIGNAVPVNLAKSVANQIKEDIQEFLVA